MKAIIVEVPGAVYEYVAEASDGSTLGTYGTLGQAQVAWPGAEVFRDPGTGPHRLIEINDGKRRIVCRR